MRYFFCLSFVWLMEIEMEKHQIKYTGYFFALSQLKISRRLTWSPKPLTLIDPILRSIFRRLCQIASTVFTEGVFSQYKTNMRNEKR